MLTDRCEKICHFIRFQHGWCAAADKDRLNDTRRSLLHGHFHFLVQRMQVVHHRLVFQHIGIEVTIEAFIRTKRDVNIYGLRGTAIVMSCHSCLLYFNLNRADKRRMN
ncbi:hypothetical protein D3C73_1252450 [compost metagenome]